MRYLFVGIIKAYQKIISPLKPRGVCRFSPTCSNYALEAYKRFGAVRGTILSVLRLLRCNPWNDGGYDPVPEKFTLKRIKTEDKDDRTL